MADTTTTTYGLTKPEVGASEDTWGTKINDNLDDIDNLLDGTTPLSAIDVTGNITVGGTVDGRDVATDGTKLDGIEAGADVTDTANVTSAGAAMLTGATFTGDINVGSNTIVVGSGVNLKESTHRPDLLTIEGQTSGYAGIQIDNTANETLWNFMADGTTLGIYDDSSNAWMTQWIDGGATKLYYAGSQKFATVTGGVQVTGALTATSNITAYSDRKLKDNLEVIPNALSKVSQLTGYTYDRIDMDGVRQSGLIAQDVQEVLPEVIVSNVNPDSGEETLSVAYGNMIGLLVEAVKELKAEVEELKGK
jgi:hypothetical protein